MPFVVYLLMFLDACVVAYAGLHFTINLILVLISSRRIIRDLLNEQIKPSMTASNDRFLPSITLLVPAYNEEVTIIESLKSLLRLRYPAFEIVICNDGSKDRTVDVLLKGFNFVPIDIEQNNQLGCSPIKGIYELRQALPPGLRRMVLIDKENGGKADALNACLNVAQGEYVTSMVADSLLTPHALLRAA